MMTVTTVKSKTGGVAIGEFKGGTLIVEGSGKRLSTEESAKRESQYLRSLFNECRTLEWFSSVTDGYESENQPKVQLDLLYVPLMTNLQRKQLQHQQENPDNNPPLSALEAINQEQFLVLTGDPGSGKSAFVNFICVCLAGEINQGKEANLRALVSPVADQKDDEPKLQQWDHGALLPVRIILRDFTVSDAFPNKNEKGTAQHLQKFIKQELKKKTCKDYFDILDQRLQDGQVLLLLDGLDEVPEASQHRQQMIECIHDFSNTHSNNRFVVTCRPYAYEQSDWQITQFTATSLKHFSANQIRVFVDHWYKQRADYEAERAEYRATRLKEAIFDSRRESLRDLVKRPLLLTLTAYLHANHHDLPEKRAELYENLLDVLISKWEQARYNVNDEKEAKDCLQTSLAEYLRVGIKDIRKVLEKLAFKAHAEQDSQSETADIAEKDLVNELYQLSKRTQEKEVQTREIIRYLQERVGIIYQRGCDDKNTVYTFPHRSFQEYLAASYLKNEEYELLENYTDESGEQFEGWIDLAVYLGCSDLDRWREVIRLAGAIISGANYEFWALIEGLSELEAETLTEYEANGLLLAGEICAENINKDSLAKKRKRSLEHFCDDMVQILTTDHLVAKDRAIAGESLAKLGDPRPEAVNIDDMQFCYVPKGRFFLGSTKEDSLAWSGDEKEGADYYDIEHSYWVARYPVTVAQFDQYIQETDAKIDERYRDNQGNTPLVYVSWNGAIQFCQWLNKRWQALGILPEGYTVTLPSETEWEMAAKGGSYIPKAIQCHPIADISHQQEYEYSLQPNSIATLQRYPWGNAPDVEKMNYNSHIGKVTAVGIYPEGKSAYGCEEMNGNVWEWTRSIYDKYPYPSASDGDKSALKARESEESTGSRVLRGGAFRYGQGDVRGACRLGSRADNYFNDVGFRVVLSPLL